VAHRPRNGAPFHGATGADSTARSAVSAQLPDAPWASASLAENGRTIKPAINAVITAVNWRAENNGTPLGFDRNSTP
jgi:hypothetical protein